MATVASDAVVGSGGRGLTNLVVVTGHAIFLDEHDAPLEDRDWFLQEYELGEPPLLMEHVHQGVLIAHSDASSLLVFSGGQSRQAAGPRSEAEGYWRLAQRTHWWGCGDVSRRCTTENYARDSYENLLFSVCRFREWTGAYPRRIHVLSWEFKRERFDLIRSALRIPEQMLTFVGVNQPPDLPTATTGERATLAAIKQDPYGCGPTLQAKRNERNPFHRTAPYPLSCPELRGLLEHTAPTMFTGKLPWGQ
jgi:hypothetical protein